MMAPPPGYAAYAPTNWGGGLSRVKPLATWILVLLGVVVAGSVISLVTVGSLVDDAQRYLVTGDEDAFDQAVAGNFVGTAVSGLPTIAIAVLTIVWLFRIAQNHQRLGRRLQWAPGWAIAGWFLPPCLYVIPTLMLQESWKASGPAAQPESDGWKRTASSPAIWIWFVVYSVAGTIGSLAVAVGQGFGSDRSDTAQYYVDNEGLLYVQPLLGIAGCVAWFVVVRALTARHASLTGEAQAR
jgi:hypothetical protein